MKCGEMWCSRWLP